MGGGEGEPVEGRWKTEGEGKFCFDLALVGEGRRPRARGRREETSWEKRGDLVLVGQKSWDLRTVPRANVHPNANAMRVASSICHIYFFSTTVLSFYN